jgi:hypothetical protein
LNAECFIAFLNPIRTFVGKLLEHEIGSGSFLKITVAKKPKIIPQIMKREYVSSFDSAPRKAAITIPRMRVTE